ncbi:uncharacterized protein LOC144703158 [Wolffia australiana]
MSGAALQETNMLVIPSGLDDITEISSKINLLKPHNGQTGNLDNGQNKIPVPTVCMVSNKEQGSNCTETMSCEVEYTESENLTDLASVDDTLSSLSVKLESKDWVVLCESLNNVRQVAIFHKEKLLDMLSSVVPMIVKSLKSPRSAVCKTAVMASADLFKVYGDQLVDLLDPLLLQLLLRSFQDKKFVSDAAERALVSMTTRISPFQLLPKLQPYLKHRNPRIRAKASFCFCRSVPHLGNEGIRSYGMEKLIHVAAAQLTDQLPESREAARTLALDLHAAFDTCLTSPADTSQPSPADASQPSPADTWEGFCRANLPPLSAQAILRLTSLGN